jgi:hypothetical protein
MRSIHGNYTEKIGEMTTIQRWKKEREIEECAWIESVDVTA